MLEEKEVPARGKWLALAVLILVLLYVFADGWLLNRIEPNAVVAVYEPTGVRALVNKSEESIRRWKWPRIPGTSIGVKEELIKDELKTATSRFALYTSDKITGKTEDKKYVQAYVVDIVVEVKDWQKFFEEINLEKINEQRKKAGPFISLVKDRFEVLADFVEDVIRRGETTDRLGKPLRTEEGYPAMNLTTRINYAYSQLVGRRNFLIALLDRYHFKTDTEIKEYLKEEIPWYWFAGSDVFEFLVQQYKEIQELTFSPYAENMSSEAAQQRLIFGEDRLQLYREAYQAYRYEKFLMERERNIKELEKRLESYTGQEKGEKAVRSFKKFLERQDSQLRFVPDAEHLNNLYNSFLAELESSLTFALRESEVEFIGEEIDKAKVKFSGQPLAEEEKRKAKEIEKAREFINDIEIAQEFYRSLKPEVETEKVDPTQLSRTIREHITSQEYLFSAFVELISLLWQEEKLEWDGIQWEKVKEEELIPFFTYYSQTNSELALNLRGITAEENEALWQAAVEEILAGEDISNLRLIISHKIEEGDTLARLAEKYGINWRLVFGRYSRDFAWENLVSQEDKMKFNQLLAQAFETGDYSAVYELVKDTSLEVGESITISKVEEFTPQWFEEEEEYRKKREATVKKYIYRWIEEFAPRVIEEYFLVSPWLDYIERTYGVKIKEVSLYIERDSMFTKDGQPKDEYYELYYSEYISGLESPEEPKEKGEK